MFYSNTLKALLFYTTTAGDEFVEGFIRNSNIQAYTMPTTTLNRVFRSNLGLSGKNILSLIILVSGGLIWFFISSTVLGRIASSSSYYENLSILIIIAVATATAALIGAFFPRGSANLRFLKIWMALVQWLPSYL